MDEENIHRREEKTYPQGNCVIARIVDHPGEGLIISWINPGLRPVQIECEGDELPIYNQVKSMFSDLSEAPGAVVTINTEEDGFVTSIGLQNKEIVSVAPIKE